MRIIKLSPSDKDMKTRDMVDCFFYKHLAERDPVGQFLVTNGRIAKDGIHPGETLVFTYLGDIVFTSRASTVRLETSGHDALKYPYYFCVDMGSVKAGYGRLSKLEKMLKDAGVIPSYKTIARSQGWPFVDEDGFQKQVTGILEKFAGAE